MEKEKTTLMTCPQFSTGNRKIPLSSLMAHRELTLRLPARTAILFAASIIFFIFFAVNTLFI
jgi:hypothetical protein